MQSPRCTSGPAATSCRMLLTPCISLAAALDARAPSQPRRGLLPLQSLPCCFGTPRQPPCSQSRSSHGNSSSPCPSQTGLGDTVRVLAATCHVPRSWQPSIPKCRRSRGQDLRPQDRRPSTSPAAWRKLAGTSRSLTQQPMPCLGRPGRQSGQWQRRSHTPCCHSQP